MSHSDSLFLKIFYKRLCTLFDVLYTYCLLVLNFTVCISCLFKTFWFSCSFHCISFFPILWIYTSLSCLWSRFFHRWFSLRQDFVCRPASSYYTGTSFNNSPSWNKNGSVCFLDHNKFFYFFAYSLSLLQQFSNISWERFWKGSLSELFHAWAYLINL